MGELQFNGLKLDIHDINWKEYMELLKIRKEALESNDEFKIMEALEKSIFAMSNITPEQLNKLVRNEVFNLARKLTDAQASPLDQTVKLEDKSLPAV